MSRSEQVVAPLVAKLEQEQQRAREARRELDQERNWEAFDAPGSDAQEDEASAIALGFALAGLHRHQERLMARHPLLAGQLESAAVRVQHVIDTLRGKVEP